MNQTPMSPNAAFVIDGDKVYLEDGDTKLLGRCGDASKANFDWLIRSAAAFHGRGVEIVDRDAEQGHEAAVET